MILKQPREQYLIKKNKLGSHDRPVHDLSSIICADAEIYHTCHDLCKADWDTGKVLGEKDDLDDARQSAAASSRRSATREEESAAIEHYLPKYIKNKEIILKKFGCSSHRR